MKKLVTFIVLGGLFLSIPVFQSCTKEQIDQVLASTTPTDAEIVEGLKSALNVGTDSSVVKTSKLDGYFKDKIIKILLPAEANKVIDVLKSAGLGSYVDDVVLKMNRAAEESAKEAKPIFVDAVTTMSITDGKNILFGDSLAATTYLNTKTRVSLSSLYKPKVSKALNSVGATDAWNLLTKTYNSIPFTTPVTTDLETYVTEKALDGLFYTVGKEEKLIRKDPLARVTDILTKVFGQLDKK